MITGTPEGGRSAPISASSELLGSTANIPQPSVVTVTPGVSPTGATETSKIYFDSFGLAAGQWISIGGLRFTANKYLTGAQVAAAFSGLSPNATSGASSASEGSYSGVFRGDFSTGSVAQVPYVASGNTYYHTILNATSTSAYTNVADLELIGSSAIGAPTLPTNTFTQGVADVLAHTESNTFIFTSMQIGQSVEIAGLKFIATSTLSADEVASAFANLTDGRTTGSQQSFGIYSGQLTGFRTGSASNGQVTFTSTTAATDVADINLSSSDFISAPPRPTADITQGLATGVSLINVSSAQNSLGRIDYAINEVDGRRATLGAYMNALTYAGDNISNTSQNLQSARSRIMDADYAKETTDLAAAEIIQQAATAMLAQANMQPQIALELLKDS